VTLEVAMSRALRFAAVLAACSLALAPALAGEGNAKGKGKGKHHSHDGDDVRVVEVVRVVEYRGGHGPPPWAPAHGYRRKHDRGRVAYVAPYGISRGICDRTLLGAAVGGAAGGLIASEVSHGRQRPAAIAGGALLGILVGGSIGNAIDQLDERCVGQVLEHGGSEQAVTWRNPDHDASYQVTPTRSWEEEGGRYCREYTTTVRIDGRPQQAWGRACRQPDGSWERVSS
jgi:surface antigen